MIFAKDSNGWVYWMAVGDSNWSNFTFSTASAEDSLVDSWSVYSDDTWDHFQAVIPYSLAQLGDDTNHRTVSDQQVMEWNDKADVFVAEYDVTTLADVQAAYLAGKILFCKTTIDDLLTLSFARTNPVSFSFSGISDDGFATTVRLNSNGWARELEIPIENAENKVASLSAQSTNAQYPSAKCVYNALATKYEKPSGGIPSTDLASAVQTSLSKADTALQSFTETDPTVPSWAKAQNPPTEIFWATYGTTTAAEVQAALDAHKIVMCQRDSIQYMLQTASSTYPTYYFSSLVNYVNSVLTLNKSTNAWLASTVGLERASFRVSSWQSTPDNNHYASEKLVKDSIDAKYTKPATGIPASDLADGVKSVVQLEVEASLDEQSETTAYVSSDDFTKIWTYKPVLLTVSIADIGQTMSFTKLSYLPDYDEQGHGMLLYGVAAGESNIGLSFMENAPVSDNKRLVYISPDDLETTSNRVTSWQATPSDSKYPSEKLVKDSLDAKVNSASLATVATSGDYSDLTNIPSASIVGEEISPASQELPAVMQLEDSSGTAIEPYCPGLEEWIGEKANLNGDMTQNFRVKSLRFRENPMTGQYSAIGYNTRINRPTLTDSYTTIIAEPIALQDDIPTISTNIVSDKASNAKTASPKAVYDEIHPTTGSAQPSGGFLPNILYSLGTLSGNTTFVLATPADANVMNHYYWTFNTSTTAPTITWPSGLTWMGGSAPTINASKHYEISVLNSIAVAMEV